MPSKKEIEASFDKEFTTSHPGDSGMGGNDPQEPLYELCTSDPNDIKDFISKLRTDDLSAIIEWVKSEKGEDYSDKNIEDRLRVFTLTPHSDESMKEFTRAVTEIASKMVKNKAIDDFVAHLTSLQETI